MSEWHEFDCMNCGEHVHCCCLDPGCGDDDYEGERLCGECRWSS